MYQLGFCTNKSLVNFVIRGNVFANYAAAHFAIYSNVLILCKCVHKLSKYNKNFSNGLSTSIKWAAEGHRR